MKVTKPRGEKHKHDWQHTGEVEVPTGKYMATTSGLIPYTRKSIIHICRDCGEIKGIAMEDIKI
jgi:hypothetical protein